MRSPSYPVLDQKQELLLNFIKKAADHASLLDPHKISEMDMDSLGPMCRTRADEVIECAEDFGGLELSNADKEDFYEACLETFEAYKNCVDSYYDEEEHKLIVDGEHLSGYLRQGVLNRFLEIAADKGCLPVEYHPSYVPLTETFYYAVNYLGNALSEVFEIQAVHAMDDTRLALVAQVLSKSVLEKTGFDEERKDLFNLRLHTRLRELFSDAKVFLNGDESEYKSLRHITKGYQQSIFEAMVEFAQENYLVPEDTLEQAKYSKIITPRFNF